MSDGDEDETFDPHARASAAARLAQRRAELARAQRGVLLRTTHIFAGVTGRALALQDGPVPSTDGTTITVPFDDVYAYERLEAELAHVVFGSDALARRAYIDEYVTKTARLAERHDVSLPQDRVARLLGGVFDILERERVRGLWARLYPGSAAKQQAQDRAVAAQTFGDAPDSLLAYFLAVANGLRPTHKDFDRFRPYLDEAVRKVQRRSPRAALLVTKWLVTALINALVRESLNLPPAQPPSGSPSRSPNPATPAGGGSGPDSGVDSETPPEGPPDPTSPEAADGSPDPDTSDAGDPDDAAQPPPQGEAPTASGETAAPPPAAPPPAGWMPPPVHASAREKLDALRNLAERLSGSLPEAAQRSLGDVQPPLMSDPEAEQRAADQAEELAKLNANDEGQMGEELASSEQQMDAELARIEDAIQAAIAADDWVAKDLDDDVRFHDIQRTDLPVAVRDAFYLAPEDADTVRRLRALFGRVRGRRDTRLMDAGFEVDVEAFIQWRANHAHTEVFRHEVRGRGFRCLLLVDRSGSMGGAKAAQVERAYRILREALRSPQVALDVWGFSSPEQGRVDIFRFEREMPSFTTARSTIGGLTPLHTAIEAGARHLRAGTDVKQLIVLTDGLPEYLGRNGQLYGATQHREYVRAQVRAAQQTGIDVRAVIVGTLEQARERDVRTGAERYESEANATVHYDLSAGELAGMFGSARHWRRLDPRGLGDGLVEFVADGFVEYLSNG